MKAILNELETNAHIILFIDRVHTIVGAEASGSLDASNMFKPALARGRAAMYWRNNMMNTEQMLKKMVP